MAIATLLICTTFVTNVPDGSVVSRQCQASAPITEVPMQGNFAKLPMRIINDVAIKPEEHAAAIVAIPMRAPVDVKPARLQHARRAVHHARHRHSKCCSVEVLPAADVTLRVQKPLSFWDQLIMARKRKMDQRLDR